MQFRRTVCVLTEQDDQDINLLTTSAGIKRTTATILIALDRHAEEIINPRITSRGIERACDLRQPEVSFAMADLIRDGLIIPTHERKSEHKGRPIKEYVIKGSIPQYIRGKMTGRVKEVNKAAASVAELFGRRIQ